jgi:hypothetical protein
MPNTELTIILSIKRERIQKITPMQRKIGHIFTPKWYSPCIITG